MAVLRRAWPAAMLALFVLYIAAAERDVPHLDRALCRQSIEKMQKAGNFTKNNATYFMSVMENGARRLLNDSETMVVTYAGCEEFCGPWSWYVDVWPRLTTWVIPVVLLVSNLELSPIDKWRYVAVAHALGDPVDSFWSLIHKMYTWHRLHEIAWEWSEIPGELVIPRSRSWKFLHKRRSPMHRRGLDRHGRARVIGAVLAGLEEICSARIQSEAYHHMALQQLLGDRIDVDSEIFGIWRQTARRLADARTNEFVRTCFAMFVYVFGLVAAFIPAIGGGGSSPPGGRIASAVFISWLIPLALLSNTMGVFTLWRTCFDVMSEFVQAATNCLAGQSAAIQTQTTASPVESHTTLQPHDSMKRTPIRVRFGNDVNDPTWLLVYKSWTQYFDSLQWLGSIYTYRPWKFSSFAPKTHSTRRTTIMALCAFFPVFICAVGAFIIMWYAVPVGFSCRNVWVVGFFVLYVLSAAYTALLYRYWGDRISEYGLWLRVLIKDLIVGVGSVMTIFLLMAGLFNNCWCWTRGIVLGTGGFFPLNTDAEYIEKAKHYYSIVVGVCLGVQVGFYVGLVIWYRQGVMLVRWMESWRRVEWEHQMPQRMVQLKEDNYLMLWYSRSLLLQAQQTMLERQGEVRFRSGRPSSGSSPILASDNELSALVGR